MGRKRCVILNRRAVLVEGTGSAEAQRWECAYLVPGTAHVAGGAWVRRKSVSPEGGELGRGLIMQIP